MKERDPHTHSPTQAIVCIFLTVEFLIPSQDLPASPLTETIRLIDFSLPSCADHCWRAFLVTLAGVPVMNIGAPFWGLVFGVLASFLMERDAFSKS